MAVHKLILDADFDDADYTLIGIHCNIEDYRLAYLLNKKLNISLARKRSDLDGGNGKTGFSIFEWEDAKRLITWSLVSNTCKNEIVHQGNQKSLFDAQEKIIQTTYLIPEFKAVNYFLKIENECSESNETYILNKIVEIPQIATAFGVDSDQLKSKHNLIFS
ncbi:IPExxxVDY family protein [Mariniflexile maritimum]|jgi:hypothetical protein|uniref:IPExxxVDY family protein n=1 Tax=Mariniflexile maritimum TaxID=2682493 RepID=UPI0012F6AC20|nr:IPExxxVDY family protein [Mariniflexile maritimum]MCB0448665.1 IPExxxVDY family protein [Confluentibacter sp.]